MITSRHATIRMQQRGIPQHIVQNIITYGSFRRVRGGAVARFVSKRDLKNLDAFLPKRDYVELDRHKRVYVVVANDHIITVGHRKRRYYR